MDAIIKMANGAEMVFELFADRAPVTVENFARLSEGGYYDGKDFYRVVSGWVIQAGKITNTGKDKIWEGHSIKGEFAENGFDTGISHRRGAISMARGDDFNGGGLEFFIVHADAFRLDGKYAAFGQIKKGLDVLDAIASVKVTLMPPMLHGAVFKKPVEPQIIKSIRLA
jgi:peptidyl-prolyl cis-trans isomerase B (cyclophilin B)